MKYGKQIAILLALVLILSACGAAKFSLTSVGSKFSLEANEAEDGDFIESQYYSVGKDRVAVIASELEKGELQIDFVEAMVFDHADDDPDVYLGDVAVSVVLGAQDEQTVELPRGDFVVRFTAIGTLTGKASVEIEKE